jgi:hypothetical protein
MNTTDVTCSKPIAGVSAANPLVAFYDIHGRKIERRNVLYNYIIIENTHTQYKQTCSRTQMFVLCGEWIRNLSVIGAYSNLYATSVVISNSDTPQEWGENAVKTVRFRLSEGKTLHLMDTVNAKKR